MWARKLKAKLDAIYAQLKALKVDHDKYTTKLDKHVVTTNERHEDAIACWPAE